MAHNPESYFPADYRGARRAFVAACEGRGVDVVARVNPKAKGPDGNPLFLDVAALGPRDAAKALILISGTHGVEGYFGSAIQTGLMRQGLAPPPGTRLIMIHALNPFGFAWNRRVNEDNVDINRNFIADHAHPPANPGYDELSEAFALRDISEESMAKADAVLAAYARSHSAAAYQQAVSGGQYNHPDGLFYGGRAQSWSSQALDAIRTEDLTHVRQAIAIDFHTGLGESGAAEMIVDAAPDTAHFARARAIWGAVAVSGSGGQSLSAPLTGTLDVGLERLLAPAELTFAALEVGTMPLSGMLRALRIANWQDHFAADKSQAGAVSRLMRDAFYVDTAVWKRRVWDHGVQYVAAALAALG
jgi:predicted deacylase